MAGYTKLFNSILASTIWREPNHVRIVWITLLAMADKNGVAEGSVPGLSDFARVSIEECRDALQRLQDPDRDSRSQEFDGRRLAEVDGGWLLLNHEKYRQKLNQDERREYLRIKKAESRGRQHGVNKSPEPSTPVNSSPVSSTPSTQAEEEEESRRQRADQRSEEEKTPHAAPSSPSSAPLLMSSLEYTKALKHCVFVGSRLSVPNKLHSDLRRILGGSEPDAKLRAWYLTVNDDLELSGEAILPNVFKWLEDKFQGWASLEQRTAALDKWASEP